METFLILLMAPTIIAGHNSARLMPTDTSENLELDAQTSDENNTAVVGRHYTFEGKEFETSRNAAHDENEYRMFYGGVIGMEIASGKTGISYMYRHVTNGENTVQLVYTGSGELYDCEMEEDTEAVDEFLARFLDMDVNAVRRMMDEDKHIDVNNLIANTRALQGTVFYELLENRGPREPFHLLVDIKNLEQQCIDLHFSNKQNPTSRGANYEVYQDTPNNIQEVTSKNGREIMSDNISPAVKQIQAPSPLAERQRRKRQLGFGRFPGTYWCGLGTGAHHHSDLGFCRGTDICCRQHDHCKTYISVFSTKYGYWNPYWHTISHCDCDKTFRSCLKGVRSFTSEAVGRIYFDLLRIRCFVLQYGRVCAQRKFWGRCIRYSYQQVATLQPLIPWN